MKKIILSFVLIAGIGISNINAQDIDKKISFGVKAEANLSNHFLGSSMDDFKSTLGFGASVGGFAKFNLHENFAIQPEILGHYKSSKLKHKPSGEKNDFEYWGLEIPVYAVGQMNLWNGRGYVGLGPYVGLGLSADLGDVDQYKKVNGNKPMQRWDFGGGVMVGYEFGFGMQINASYKVGFINALDHDKDNSKMLNETVSLGLAYRF